MGQFLSCSKKSKKEGKIHKGGGFLGIHDAVVCVGRTAPYNSYPTPPPKNPNYKIKIKKKKKKENGSYIKMGAVCGYGPPWPTHTGKKNPVKRAVLVISDRKKIIFHLYLFLQKQIYIYL